MNKKVFRYFSLIVLCLLLIPSALNVAADGFYTYGYTQDGKPVEAPAATQASFTITGISAGTTDFNTAQDLFIADDGKIYIADTGNNRIVILNSNGTFLREISGFTDPADGATGSFNGPAGVFVAKNRDLYICDSGNSRIIHLDSGDAFIQSIVFESSAAMPQGFIFKPVKVAVDDAGRMFVVSEGFNNGLLEFTAEGKYIQYMGAAKVTLTPSQLFWRSISTKAQRAKTSSSVSTEYSNVEIDDQGFLLVTTSAYEYWQYQAGNIQSIRRLNAKGNDVLIRLGDPSGDIDYPDAKYSRASYKGPSTMVDICTMPYQNYAALDQNRGRVFVYNSDGELMYEFGGPGDFNGGLKVPTALAYHDERFFVIDSSKNQINVYTLTGYGQLLNNVSKARADIDYEAEEKLWNQIVMENANCELAMRGLGTAAYRKQEMETAMTYFKLANDREDYSKAFVFVRREWIENNAVLLLSISAVCILAILALRRGWRRLVAKSGTLSYASCVNFSGYTVFHPIRGFWELKREHRGSLPAALTFLAATCVVKILSALATGFLFNERNLNSYNLLVDVLLIIGAMLLWCISQWCVTVLMNGAGKFKDIFIASCYALTPYIWLTLLATAVSRVLSMDEGEFHTVLVAIGIVYMIFLLIMSVMSTHDFSMRKTLLVVLITLIVILLIVFIAMLLIALSQQMVAFVKDLSNEISMRF